MLFNSIDYIIFLPLVIILYYIIPSKYRWIFLLTASYYFYMSWKAEYAILIMVSTLIDYFCGTQMEKQDEKRKRRKYLFLSLFANLGLLFSFKYYNFFASSINEVLDVISIAHHFPRSKFLLPVGISFYTFQTLSYTIEVYQGKQKAERHLGYFAVYVSFFPQLVAGPIERFSNLGPQFRENKILTYENVANGLRLILFGLFIKMCIADNLSPYVDKVYDNPAHFSGIDIILAMIFYSFQIYSDFHGYSTIAIGSALLMGIRIMDNFNVPYASRNIAEFWQRWHISLSTWFRDYLYLPLGGNRVKKFQWALNILIVFTVSGLWHGANWTFIIWGAIFGVAYLAEKLMQNITGLNAKKINSSFWNILLSLKTFIIVTIAWVFFRSQNLTQAKSIFINAKNNLSNAYSLAVEHKVLLMFIVFVIIDIALINSRFDKFIGKRHFIIRWLAYAILLFAVIFWAGVEEFPFIYFQF